MSEMLQTLAVFWWSWIAPLALQGGLLLLLVAVLDALLPERTWPELRACLWLLALVKLALPPSLTSPVSLARWVPETFSFTWPSPVLATDDPARVVSWAGAIALAWLLGLTLLTVWGAVRHARLRRSWEKTALRGLPPWLAPIVAEAARRLGLRRPPEVWLLPHLSGPFVAGVVRPRVYLPASLDPAEAEHVVLHELAHLKRRDLWLAAAVLGVQLIYWFHPLVWWARRRLDAVREQCCDRTVTRALGGAAEGYRRTLVRFAARRLAEPAGLAFVRPRSPLLVRLRLLEHAAGERKGLRRVITALAAAGMLGCCVPMARPADQTVAAVAELVERPPGCLPLRYMVLKRLAEEQKQN